jgi:hypothetical protein
VYGLSHLYYFFRAIWRVEFFIENERSRFSRTFSAYFFTTLVTLAHFCLTFLWRSSRITHFHALSFQPSALRLLASLVSLSAFRNPNSNRLSPFPHAMLFALIFRFPSGLEAEFPIPNSIDRLRPKYWCF